MYRNLVSIREKKKRLPLCRIKSSNKNKEKEQEPPLCAGATILVELWRTFAEISGFQIQKQ